MRKEQSQQNVYRRQEHEDFHPIMHTSKRLEMALAWAKMKIGRIAGHLRFPKGKTYQPGYVLQSQDLNSSSLSEETGRFLDNDDAFKKRTGSIESHMPTHGNGMSAKVCRSIVHALL